MVILLSASPDHPLHPLFGLGKILRLQKGVRHGDVMRVIVFLQANSLLQRRARPRHDIEFPVIGIHQKWLPAGSTDDFDDATPLGRGIEVPAMWAGDVHAGIVATVRGEMAEHAQHMRIMRPIACSVRGYLQQFVKRGQRFREHPRLGKADTELIEYGRLIGHQHQHAFQGLNRRAPSIGLHGLAGIGT